MYCKCDKHHHHSCFLSNHKSASGILYLCKETGVFTHIWFHIQKHVLSICCLTCYPSPSDRRWAHDVNSLSDWFCENAHTCHRLLCECSACACRLKDSRMLSVLSCIVSVLRRLSASMKAPVSTVSNSMVAQRSCSATDSSLHAAWDCRCSRLFTVSTMACTRWRRCQRCRRTPLNAHTHSHSDIWTSQ